MPGANFFWGEERAGRGGENLKQEQRTTAQCESSGGRGKKIETEMCGDQRQSNTTERANETKQKRQQHHVEGKKLEI